jgi:hypothetical protein
MTRLTDNDIDKIERALSEAHRSSPEPALGADWAARVMQDIRRQGREDGAPTGLPGIDRLVWRTAAVAATLALVFAGSVLVSTGDSGGELTSLLSREFEAGVAFIEE